MEKRLHRMSRVSMTGGRDSADSVKRSKAINMDDRSRGQQILMEARVYYRARSRFRQDRERCKRYLYGDQWGDVVEVDGKLMTEYDYIKKQGNIPLKTNLIRKLVNTVVGLFISQNIEPTCVARDRDEQRQAETMSTVLQYNMQLNRMKKLYADSMEEYLQSGFIVHRKWAGWRNDRMDCWTDYVQPNNFFCDNHMRDLRGWDCTFLGEIHDLSFGELMRYVKTPADYHRLEKIYKHARDVRVGLHSWEDFGYSTGDVDKDFLSPADTSLCRVIEVWRKENKPRYRCHDYNSGELYKIEVEELEGVLKENNRRWEQAQRSGIPYEEVPFIVAEWFIDSYWYYYFLTPFGDIIEEGETPYAHKEHPYVFSAYPFIDGEIHSFVADVIDQQRYVNRLITLNDMIMRSSAKGLLVIPKDATKGLTEEQIRNTWAMPNGVLVMDIGKSGMLPQQISSNATNIGLHEMLGMQLRMMEDITGVNGSLQGKSDFSGMSAAFFSMQTQNATTTLQKILDGFQNFILDATYKDVKNIQQYYDQKRTMNIAGNTSSHLVYDPEKIREVEFDLSVVPSRATPVYRSAANEFLMEMWRQGAINVEQLLEHGDFPFSDALLQSLQSQREQMEQGQMPGGVPPELMSQVEQGANMKAMESVMG